MSRSRFEWKVFQILERSQVSKEARHPPNLRKIAGFKRGKASPVFPLTVFQRVGQDGPEKTTNAQFLTVETQKRQRKKQRRAGTVERDNTQQVSQQDWPRLLVSPNGEQVRAPRTPHPKGTLGIAVKFMFCCCQFDLLFSESAVHFFVTGILCFLVFGPHVGRWLQNI